MNENPYQSPTAPLDPPPPSAAPPYFDSVSAGAPRVEEDSLVVSSGTVLPPVCVKTNQPVSADDIVHRRLYWWPTWPILFLLCGGPLVVIILYFVTRKECLITFALHPSVRKRYRKRLTIKVLTVTALFLAIPLTSSSDAGIAVFVLLCIAIVWLLFGNAPLKATEYRNGLFWIDGCSQEYLASIASHTPVGCHDLAARLF